MASKRPKIVVSQPIFPEILERLSERCRVVVGGAEKVKDADGLLSFLTFPVDARFLSKLPRLKIVSNFAVGYDNIDVEAATKRKIYVCNTPAVLTEATADLTWALILACARRIPEAEQFVRKGKFKGWRYDGFLGQELYGRALGIIGMGRIGAAVARRARGFGMDVFYFSQSAHEEAEHLGARRMDLEALLKRSDVVSLHVPLNKAPRQLIGERELNWMKPTAILINTSRGPIVDEPALVLALKRRKIWAAGLDVYENEPKLAPGLLKLSNVVLLPHIGSATAQTRRKMAEIAADNLIAFFKGQIPPPNCVNPSLSL